MRMNTFYLCGRIPAQKVPGMYGIYVLPNGDHYHQRYLEWMITVGIAKFTYLEEPKEVKDDDKNNGSVTRD